MKKLYLFLIIGCCLVNITYSQEARVILSTRVNHVKSYEGSATSQFSCQETGTEEYTAHVHTAINDNLNPLDANSGCLTCNNNGNCTYGENTAIITNRNTKSVLITTYIRAWENDFGGRCNFNGGDDCAANPSDSYNVPFRADAYPSNSTYTESDLFDADDHEWSIDFTWKYSNKNFNNTNITAQSTLCTNQSLTASSGGIRTWVFSLTAGVPYEFETTSGPDTYLRIFSSDGYTIAAFDDDGGPGTLSKITYTPSSSGVHFVEVSQFPRKNLLENAVLSFRNKQVVISCSANVITTATNGCGSNVTLTPPTTTCADPISSTVGTRSDNQSLTAPYPVGTTTVTWTATNTAGTTAQCVQTVTVQDQTPPTAICKDITVQISNLAPVTIAENAVDNGSFDACGIQSFDTDVTSFDCNNVPPVTMTVTDVNGNTSSCTANVTLAPNNLIIYVKKNATGSNNGTSWANAFTDLQSAISASGICGGQIWVAAGTYYPDEGGGQTNNDQNASFVMRNNLSILGGFPNTGNPGLGQRNWVNNPTVLSGEIGNLSNTIDNSFRIINNDNNGLNNTAILDGFTITSGRVGIYNEASSPAVLNCVFTNHDPIVNGGAMYNNAASPAVTGCTFTNNTAVKGAGMYNVNGSNPVLTDCSFIDNMVTHYGAGMYNEASSPTLNNCSFSGNSATSSGVGGGMYNDASAPSLTNCTFNDNFASNGAGMYNANISSPTLNGCNFTLNIADFQGGGMYNYNGSNPMLSNCTFDNNEAYYGGGMHNSSSSPILNDCNFNNNMADGADGGGMYNDDASTVLTNCNFNNNSSPSGDGGGMYNSGSGSLVLTNCSFEGNTASGGGAMSNSVPSLTLNGCIFNNNQASGLGGGMKNNNVSTFTLTNCSFTSNIAFTDGGGMYNSNTSPSVENTPFNNNFAGRNGGAMYNISNASPTITGCTFTANTAGSKGGALSNENDSSPIVTNCTFDGNAVTSTSSGYGGAIQTADFGVPVITNCTFSNNMGINGGAIANEGRFNDMTVTNCYFNSNTATSRGGAVYLFDSDVTFINCVFWNNSAISQGGGIFNNNSATSILKNCTLNSNSASQGGGIYNVSSGLFILTNCILWGNSTEWTQNGGGFPPVNYCIIQGGYPVGSNNLNTDPFFVNPAIGNLRLDPCSPAINAGNNGNVPGGITTDLDGNARISQTTVDMGPYEWQAGGTPCNNPPIAVCQDITVTADANCQGVAVAADFDGGSTDPENGPLTFSVNPVPPYFSLGTTPVILTVTDNGGKSSTCSANVTVSPPQAICQDITVQLDATGHVSIAENAVHNGYLNPCSNLTFDTDVTNFNCTHVPSTSVTMTVTDISGNSNNCSATVTVNQQNNLIVYVKKNAVGANNGTSWADAFTDLQTALAAAGLCGGQIWVAAGTYYPDEGAGQTNNDPNASFVMKNNLSILGGFPNSGNPGLGQRDWAANPTILSGNIGGSNSYHVILNNNNGLNNSALLDGFTITAGSSSSFGILHGGGMHNNAVSPTVKNCTFTNNYSFYNGGGMYNNAASPVIMDCSFISNSTGNGDGGGMYNENGAAPTLTNCYFNNNSAWKGGGMYNDAASPTLSGCTFDNNTVVTQEGGGMANFNGSVPTLTNCDFTNHSHNGMYNNGASPMLTGCNFNDNSGFDGGGMWNENASAPTLTNCTFDGNSASRYGGGLANDASTPILEGCSFINNFSPSGGGGVSNINGASPSMTNCTFTGNSTGHSGGGIYNQNSSPTLTDCNFNTNSAPNYGGGIYNYLSSPMLDGCNFNGNTAFYGAGVYNDQPSSPTLIGCNFNNNIASDYGGGMYSYQSTPVVTNCIFDSNTADQGGGVYNYESSPVLDGCAFSGNMADYGAGMYNYVSSAPTLTNCSFTSNSASIQGGGLYNNFNTSPTVTSCTFSGNSANDSGGGIYTFVSLPITNCTFWNNSATNTGGALYNYQSSVVTNCTFNGNTANQGGAIFNSNFSTPVVANCILWGNSSEIMPTYLSVDLSYSIIQGGYTNASGPGNLDRNPLFVNAASGDLHLDPCSNAINAGDASAVPAGVTTDLDGNNRIFDGAVDMGAYEYQGIFVSCNAPPVAVCQNLTIGLDGSNCYGIATGADFAGGSTDPNNDPLTFTVNPAGPYQLHTNTTVTVTVSDGEFSDNCSATVYVIDDVPPHANCQNITVNLNANGNVNVSPFQVSGFSFDDCQGISASLSRTNFNCNHIGNNPVTLTIFDFSGNSSACNAIITVQDKVAPVASCQNVTVQLDSSGNGSTTATAVNNGSSDACGIQSLSLNPTNFTCANAGANVATLTVTDNYNNVSTCTATVTVQDAAAPVALCQDVTVQLDANGNASGTATAALVDNGSSDDCGIQSLSLNQATLTCADIGAQTMILTVTDYGDQTSTCTAIVTVEDHVAPVALCQDITIQLDGSGLGSISTGDIDAGSNDACGIANLALDQTSFICSDVGTSSVVLTVTDNNGQSSTCTASVAIEDNVAPIALCQDQTVQLGASGSGSISTGAIDAGSNDACGIANLVLDQTSFDCTNTGTNSVILTVTDNNGQVSTCTASVTVEDNVVPVALCQGVTVQLDASGSGSISTGAIDAGSNDACGIANLALDQTSFDCANVGSNSVILTVTDNNGQVSICNATVIVEDNVPPVALCQDVTVQLDASGSGAITTGNIDAGSSDACGIANLALDQTSFNCTNVGANTVNLSVTDNNGQVSTCTAIVTVEDNGTPVALCQDVTVQLDTSGDGSITTDDIGTGSNDACGIANLALDQTSFNCTNVGANTVNLTVTDNNGQVSTCTATVTVEDNVAPVALCQDVTVQLDASGSGSITTGNIDAGSGDACGVANLALDQTSFGCSNTGSNTVILTVTDNNGQLGTCTAIVTVEDNVAPVALCQDVTIQLDASGSSSITTGDIDAGSNDACGIGNLALDQTSFDCTNIGLAAVILTVTDNNGQVSTCTATVTVEDNVVPVALCQDVTVELDASGVGLITTGDIDAGSNDACGIANLALDQTSFNCTHTGPNTVTLTITDNNGEVITCTSTVTVEDNVEPVAICQDVTVQLDAVGGGSITTGDINAGSNDACGIANLALDQTNFSCANTGANMVILTVTDVNNNANVCTATVTVEDNIPPIAICQDLTIQLDANGNGSTNGAAVNNGSSDACGIANLVLNKSNFTCADIGAANPVTLTVTDNHNNASTCSANITVEDNGAPNAVCQDVTVQLDASGGGSITSGEVDAGSNDACSSVSLALSNSNFACSDLGSANIVTLTVTDDEHNSGTCTATVTVADNLQPSVDCQADMTLNTDPGACEATLILAIPTSSDNCAVTVLRYRFRPVDAAGDNIPGEAWSGWFPESNPVVALGVGHWKIQWQAKDASNNQKKCAFIVEVVDNEAPVPVCFNPIVEFNGETDISLDATTLWDEVSSTDNCGAVNFVGMSVASVACNQLGATVPVTVTVSDIHGNESTCVANVYVGGLPCGWRADPNGVDCANADANYTPGNATFDLTSDGCYNPAYYRPSDPHGFIQRQLCGDGSITAQVTGVSGNGWAGISMRESNDPSAPMLQLMINGSNVTRRELRQAAGSAAYVYQFQTQGKNWLRLTRAGNQFSAFHSSDGVNWSAIFVTNIAMAGCIEMGLITMNGASTGTVTGVFENVSFTGGATPLSAAEGAVLPQMNLGLPSGDISVYPNPSYGRAYIDLTSFLGKEAQVSLYLLTGQKVKTMIMDEVQTPVHRLDLDGLVDGTFIVEVLSDQERVVKKLVLTRY